MLQMDYAEIFSILETLIWADDVCLTSLLGIS